MTDSTLKPGKRPRVCDGNPTCTKCRKSKTCADFHPEPDRPAGHRWTCRECTRQVRASWVKANRHRQVAYTKAYFERHPEKLEDRRRRYTPKPRTLLTPTEKAERYAEWERRRRYRKANLTPFRFPTALIRARFEYFGNRCWMCGTNDTKLTVDHVKPLVAGGLHIPANIRPACGPCNSSKCNRWYGVRALDGFIHN